jgi:putative CocE/NonD family hydrolase
MLVGAKQSVQLIVIATATVSVHPSGVLASQTAPQRESEGSDLSHGDVPRQFTPVRDYFDYLKREVMIPMRDGIKLHTVIVIPKGIQRGPIVMDRTPYGADKFTENDSSPVLGSIPWPTYGELAHAGYIIVIQDVRGRYGSQGEYVLTRPLSGALNATAVDHSTDTWDTIDWLVNHVPESNGRIGTIGTSYGGFTALMSLVNPHPALKACVPINPLADGWRGDDWFHNGAFRQEMIGWIYHQTAKKDSSESWVPAYYDDYEAFMHYGSAGAYGRAMGLDQLPAWQRLTQHPAYDQYWQEQALDRALTKFPLTVPTLLVDSLWDQEDIYGAPAVYAAVKATASGNVHLVLGPWVHAQPNKEGSKTGPLDWGMDTAKWFRQYVLIPFLDEHLKNDAPAAHIAPVIVFESGTNEWRQLLDWPMACPSGCSRGMTPLYLGPNGTLSLGQIAPPINEFDDYVSDPMKPVTYRAPPTGSNWSQWLVDDQRFAAVRPDVLVYRSQVLHTSVKISGQPFVHLFASTSGTDSDWIVKLIDVYPDVLPEKPELGGYQLAIAMDILRGRYRDNPAHPSPIPTGRVVEYSFALPNVSHVFLPGHQIMVQVQSSWFPLYDRNPQTYVKNIFFAEASDYHKATQRVYHARGRQSYLALPVIQ